MILDVTDRGISHELLRKGTHESSATIIYRSLVKNGMNVVDIGSNIGYYAIQAAELVGNSGRVYALEPIPRNYNLLKHNIELNHFTNIETYNMAVGDQDGILQMYLSDRSNLHSAVKPLNATGQTIEVPCIKLDTFLKNKGRIDLIRMDVEGFEVKILEGLKETLKNQSPILFIEMHPALIQAQGWKLTETLHSLASYGYVPFAILKLGLKKPVVISISQLINTPYFRAEAYHIFLVKKGNHGESQFQS